MPKRPSLAAWAGSGRASAGWRLRWRGAPADAGTSRTDPLADARPTAEAAPPRGVVPMHGCATRALHASLRQAILWPVRTGVSGG
ncbi:MAG: hypothetical protein Q7U13_14520 [Rhodoferax sp.]|nr:hypothetical protein [Rhodoferax sp.]